MNTSSRTLSAYLLLCTICITASEEYPRDPNQQALIIKKFGEKHNLEQIQNTNQRVERLERQVSRLIEGQVQLAHQVDRIASQVTSPESHPHADLHKYARQIEAFIEEPEDSFEGLEETLTEYQKHIKDLVTARSRSPVEPRELPGILLFGPPGTGKTRFASALAEASNLTFCRLVAGYFNEGFGGEGSSRARSLFLVAEKYNHGTDNGKNPGILILIDEIDILAKKRNSSGGGFTRNMETTAASLWTTLSTISRKHKRTVVVTATNKPENCDPAIMDRFGKQVEFDHATSAQLIKAVNYHISKSRYTAASGSILIPLRTSQIPLSFRSMKNLVREACDYAYVEQTSQLTQHHFDKAWKRVLEAEQRKSKPSEDEERRQREIESHAMQQRQHETNEERLLREIENFKVQQDQHEISKVQLTLALQGLAMSSEQMERSERSELFNRLVQALQIGINLRSSIDHTINV